MWQFITVESGKAKQQGFDRGQRIGSVTHGLTHRRYEFRVFRGAHLKDDSNRNPGMPRNWVTLGELDRYPLSRPHLKIADMLRKSDEAEAKTNSNHAVADKSETSRRRLS